MTKLLILMMLMCALLLPGLAQAEDDVFTPQMLENSLVSVGNTQRVQAAIAKARAGEAVTIAYLGGSITEGALAQPQQTRCYAYLSAHAFADAYMPDPKLLHYVNAGISGTPSVLGITRLEQDVLRHEPDIVFVEFAVNDSNQMPYRIVYESMIRKLLADECQPAVVLIFTFMESGYSCQPHMQQVGKQYDLGMISVKDAIQPQITLGNITWRDYSSDYTHPNTAAHRFISEMIGNYFAKAEATARPGRPSSTSATRTSASPPWAASSGAPTAATPTRWASSTWRPWAATSPWSLKPPVPASPSPSSRRRTETAAPARSGWTAAW